MSGSTMKVRSARSLHATRGFTLVEALVALVILSIGLLGVAGLQLTSLRANTSSTYRSQATFLAYDIADRMRANRQEALAGSYISAFGAALPSSPATLAETDLVAWKTRVTNGSLLPVGANAEIAWADATNRVIAIRIRWDDSHGDTQEAQNATGVITFEMRTRV
jgi:type IV pilus assembly protein PilV